MDQNAFSPEQLEKLVNYASAQLGTSPEQLKAAFAKGGLGGIASSLSDEELGKAEAIMRDKEKAAELLNNPQVQQLLARLLGNG
ncbi:MAG: hypothetical protein IJB26_06015 [Clostridia bacterium]|nr:hypothetical protein [Clostridia bacterium]